MLLVMPFFTDLVTRGCKSNQTVNTNAVTSNGTVSSELLKFLAHIHHDVTQVGKPPKICNANCTQSSENVIPISSDFLKFLAHIHHDVFEVGTPPHKHVSQEMTEVTVCKHSDVLGGNNSKKCKPCGLNEIGLDLEVAAASKSQPINPLSMISVEKISSETEAKNDRTENDIMHQYLEGGLQRNKLNSFYTQSQYDNRFPIETDETDGDSHSQDIDKGSQFLSKCSKKREVAHSQDGHHHDNDYSEKIKNENSNEEDYYINEEPSNQQQHGGMWTRIKKRKKNEKVDSRNNFDIKSDEPMESISELESENYDILSDVKDSEQEEAIQTFIESLNSPPETFIFDVDNNQIESTRSSNNP